MPVVLTNPLFKNQSGWNGSTQAYVTQLNFGQMLRQVTQWNPDLDPMVAGRMINDAQREVVDWWTWYGLKVKGVINVPTVTTQGQATVNFNSNIVQGTGTNWMANGPNSVVGLQFRAGFSYPWATILSCDQLNQRLTIDLPFGGANLTNVGYQIQQAYAVLGANIKYVVWATNQQQGWPIIVNADPEQYNFWDTWRFSLGWTKYFANRAPTPDGQYQVELWPTPFQAQTFPFEAYVQPADMVLDSDCPPPFLRSDVLVDRAIADAKMIGGRTSKYYDPVVSQMKMTSFNKKIEDMRMANDMMDLQSLSWDKGQEDGYGSYGEGSVWAQSHDF